MEKPLEPGSKRHECFWQRHEGFMQRPQSFWSVHRAYGSVRELLAAPGELLVVSRELLTASRELLAASRELLAASWELLAASRELLAASWELLKHTENFWQRQNMCQNLVPSVTPDFNHVWWEGTCFSLIFHMYLNTDPPTVGHKRRGSCRPNRTCKNNNDLITSNKKITKLSNKKRRLIQTNRWQKFFIYRSRYFPIVMRQTNMVL